jgi:predicted nucleotide-binding protein
MKKNVKRKNKMNDTQPTILWVDDDVFFMHKLVGYVRDAGYNVLTAEGPDEALDIFQKYQAQISLVVLDVMMPHGQSFSPVESMGGYATGLALSRRILNEHPDIRILAFSVVTDQDIMEWFQKNTVGYILKPAKIAEVIRMVHKAIGGNVDESHIGPRIFIVHGHDEGALYALKNYVQNTLKLPEPIVLREQASQGRTIIEKFEALVDDVDLVFVLLTPDDEMAPPSTGSDKSRRARQNVILELGFFLGKLQRLSGKIILLYKGSLDIPSDISGIIYIDITNGLDAAGEQIRKEIATWLL